MRVKLRDVCTKIGSGATPKGGATVYIDSGVSFIRSQNVYNLQFDYDGLTHITDEAAKKLDGVTIQNEDVLVNITGDSVARTCVVPDDVIPARVNQHVAIVRPDRDILRPRFLNYYLASPYMQAHMLGLAVGKGASRNAMTKDMIGNFDIPCPPLEIQDKVVEILSAYDNLIENNQKQIKLLEEAAQRLYKEWFVDLRFPGWESAEIVDGVPKGWSNTLLKETIDYEIGGGWGEEEVKEQCESPAFVIRGTDLYGVTHGDFLSIPYRFHKKSNLESRNLQNGDIVFEVSGGSKTEGVARTTRITATLLEQFSSPVMCASFCKLVRPKSELSQLLYDHFVFLRASGKTSEYDKKSASSIVNYRWKDFLVQESVLIPSNEILVQYNQCATSIYEKIVTCSIIVEKAKATRDRLLPKLMSGELEV
jgi:type I restriction enzyme S subunit